MPDGLKSAPSGHPGMTNGDIFFPSLRAQAKQSISRLDKCGFAPSRSLSSGAHSRDPLGPRNDELDPTDLPAMANQIWQFGLRQINPTGKSLLIFRNESSPRLQKYFCFLPRQISSLIRAVPFRQEGRCATSSTWSGMRWTRAARETNAVCLRTAKSCGSDAPILGVKPVRRSAGDGVKQRGHRGERV